MGTKLISNRDLIFSRCKLLKFNGLQYALWYGLYGWENEAVCQTDSSGLAGGNKEKARLCWKKKLPASRLGSQSKLPTKWLRVKAISVLLSFPQFRVNKLRLFTKPTFWIWITALNAKMGPLGIIPQYTRSPEYSLHKNQVESSSFKLRMTFLKLH